VYNSFSHFLPVCLSRLLSLSLSLSHAGTHTQIRENRGNPAPFFLRAFLLLSLSRSRETKFLETSRLDLEGGFSEASGRLTEMQARKYSENGSEDRREF